LGVTARRWTYLSLAAVALVGLTVVGILNRPIPKRELGEHEWGDQIQIGSGILNRIHVVAAFDEDRRRFAYYTGGNGSGSGERSPAPERIIAEAVHGDVTVRMRAFDSFSRERASDEAAEVARVVSLATTRIWPARPTAVEVDVHFMPDGAPFSLAKRIDWREGDSYEIAVFTREGKSVDTGTALHELYHALAIRWSLGTKSPASGSRLVAALAYEEIAGDLLAMCGRLLANESLQRETQSVSFLFADRRLEVPLNGNDLATVLRLMSSEVPLASAQGFRAILVPTITADVFGEQQTIALESPQAQRLLARCRELAANPMLLQFRLTEMRERIAASEARTADD
jgi:hypothetical protein